jgi:DNA-3-methyladenine glycosylase
MAAQSLLGALIYHGECAARIVETEAYRSGDDPASHAFRGLTARNAVMYGPVGVAYVYFNYGVHWMFNVVAHGGNEAGAVLIRAAEPVAGLEVMARRRGVSTPEALLSGPGKLCQALGITKEHYGVNLLAGGELRLEPGEPPREIAASPRIGIATGKGHEIPWRFVDADAPQWLSRRH